MEIECFFFENLISRLNFKVSSSFFCLVVELHNTINLEIGYNTCTYTIFSIGECVHGSQLGGFEGS